MASEMKVNLRAEVVDLCSDLASINSVNPGLMPGADGESVIGEYVADWMRTQSFDVFVEEAASGRPNVIGVVEGGMGPTLLLNGHLDTVGAADPETFTVRVNDDRIIGRGVLDTKGGLAAGLVAAASLGTRPPGDIIIAAVADEEDQSIGTARLLESWSADGSVVLEPSGLDIGLAHRGFAIIEATLSGRAAHTSRPEAGRNAIEPAGSLIAEIAALDRTLAQRTPHPTLGHATVQTTLIAGGTELFTIPDRCTLAVEVRTLPETAREDIATARALIRAAAEDDIDAEANVVTVRDPFEVPHDSPVATVLADSLRSLGQTPTFSGLPFWTDAALQVRAGIPSVVFGPGGDGIHSAHEWVSIHDLVLCAEALREMMLRFGRTEV